MTTTMTRATPMTSRGKIRNHNVITKTFSDITVVDDSERIVYGIASSNTADRQGGVWKGQQYDGDIVDEHAIKEAVDDYMRWANIREMHSQVAAGTALDVSVIDGKVYIIAKISDDAAWRKVKEGVYKGFSIGGRVLDAVLERAADGRTVRRITKLHLTEISLVDRPANPEAVILLAKRETMTNEQSPNQDPIAELTKLAERADSTTVEKAVDTSRVVQLIQELRDQAELEGDLEAAARYSEAILLLIDASRDDEDSEQQQTDMNDAAVNDDTTNEQPLALSARGNATKLHKVGRKLSKARQALIKRALLDYAKMLADVGDEDAIKMLNAIGGAGNVSVEETVKSMTAELRKMLSPIAQTLLAVSTSVDRIANQPAAGGPILRATPATIAKRMDLHTSTTNPMPALSDADIAELRRLALVETHPVRKAQYEKQLAELATRV